MGKVFVTLADGARREFESGISCADIARQISPSLAGRAVAAKIDGALRDLAAVIEADSELTLVTRDDDSALELIRHDCAHILAQAALELHPETKVAIGPVIDNGFYYDFLRPQPFVAADLEAIEERMREIVARDLPITREVKSRQEAREFYEQRDEPLKVELVDSIPAGEEISFYRQGDFVDLCRGPHLRTTADAGRAFKLLRVAGAYWRGDSSRPQLQRIYGTAWRAPAELKAHLTMLEEAARRDHRRLGREMGLFHLQEEAAGMVFWHDPGWTLYRALESYMRRRLQAADYEEVKTPQLVERKLWEMSGHWEKFDEQMFVAESPPGVAKFVEDPQNARIFALKPMNCPCHVQIYKQGVKSYRDLPLRMAEFGSCHRAEPSGALHGLMRARHFVQDDAHIFCAEEQVVSEAVAFCELLRRVYADLGFTDVRVNFADRPSRRAGDDAAWTLAEESLRAACRAADLEIRENPGEGAFYGPKLEFVLRDAIGREWQCGTLQTDFVLPARLDAEYTAADGARKRPVMLHRAILGSFERFIGILLEHHAGRLPLWLCPTQVVVATISEATDDYARETRAALAAAGLRATVDLRNEKISYKVREHSVAKRPVLLVVGKREAETQTVAVRRLGQKSPQAAASREETIAALVAESRPPDLAA